MNSLIGIENKQLGFNGKNVFIILDQENNPRFKGRDICNILEYEKSRTSIQRHVEKEDKISFKEFSNALKQGVYNIDIKTIFINKSGLYSLILSLKTLRLNYLKNGLLRKFYPQFESMGNINYKNH